MHYYFYFNSLVLLLLIIKSKTILNLYPRTPRGGGWIPPPWRFSPVTFLMIPIAKIASAYLLLGMGDTFWHMWHHLDAVTWHMSWRHMYMTVVKIHCFYHCLLIEISFDVDVIKKMQVGVVFNIIEVVESKNVKINHVTLTDNLEIWGQTSFNLSFRNRTCSYDAELILVFILTFLRSGISKNCKINHLTSDGWPGKTKVINIYYYDLPYLWLYV